MFLYLQDSLYVPACICTDHAVCAKCATTGPLLGEAGCAAASRAAWVASPWRAMGHLAGPVILKKKHLWCKPDLAIHKVIMEMTLYCLILGNLETGLIEALDHSLTLYLWP